MQRSLAPLVESEEIDSRLNEAMKVIKSNDTLPGALYVKMHNTTTERSGGILLESQLKVQATLQEMLRDVWQRSSSTFH